jgi:hypothetical protein
MKTKLSLIMVLALAGSSLADTTLTIVIPTADEARMTEAFGSILNLGRPANAQEITGAISQWLAGQTTDYEKRKNMQAFSPPPLEFNGTPIPAGSPIPEKAKAAATAKPKK